MGNIPYIVLVCWLPYWFHSFSWFNKNRRGGLISLNPATRGGGQEIRNTGKTNDWEIEGGKREEHQRKRGREAHGTDQQGCRDRSSISQHHLLPVPGLKAPLMANLPHLHTSIAPPSGERPLRPFLSPPQPCPSHPLTQILHSSTNAPLPS